MRTSLLFGFTASVLSLLTFGCSGPVDHMGTEESQPTAKLAAPTGKASPATTPRTAPTTRAIDLDLDGASNTAAPQATEYFVWAAEGEERTLTYHLDASGRPIETIEGLVVATDAGVWRFRKDDELVPTFSCEHLVDGEENETADESVGFGHVTRASLEHMTSGVAQVVVEPGDDMLGTADVNHSVDVVASVGPYLFLEERTWAYTCGAHGNTSVSASIWNTATGKAVAMPTDLGQLDQARQTAIRELSYEEDEMFRPTDDTLELTEIMPRFSPDGTLVMGLQFTAPTCYACSGGGWGSYTKSTVIDGPTLPGLLAPFEKAPTAVRAFLKAHPDVMPGGWSAR